MAQDLGTCLKLDRHRLLVHVFHVVEETWRSAARRDYYILEFGNLVKHVSLNLAESALAFLGKNLGYLAMKAVFDIPVEVEECHLQLVRQGFAYCCLASPHVAYEYYSLHGLIS